MKLQELIDLVKDKMIDRNDDEEIYSIIEKHTSAYDDRIKSLRDRLNTDMTNDELEQHDTDNANLFSDFLGGLNGKV